MWFLGLVVLVALPVVGWCHELEVELQCSLPALDDAAVAFGAGFAIVVGPAIIAWGGAILIKAIGAIR